MLLAVLVHAFILRAIRPLLDAFSVLLVFEPVADVGGSVRMNVCPVSMSLVIEPLSFVDVAIRMDQLTVTVRLVAVPVSAILAAVLPQLLSVTILHAVQKFAGVDSSVAERDGSILLALIIVDHFCGDATLSGH